MKGSVSLAALFIAVAFAGCVAPDLPLDDTAGGAPGIALAGDAVVIAVIDFGINAYHLDWGASTYPLNTDDDLTNDMAFNSSPEEWLPGFVAPAGGVHALNLSLSTDPDAKVADLMAKDKDVLGSVKKSTADDVHLYYVPGTKIIGLVEFGSGAIAPRTHGGGSSSVSAGNIYGSCRECLVVFVNNAGGEDAFNWVAQQDWIDVVTNSYGYSAIMRDRLYSGSNLALSKDASERGQTIFFSAGNGQANTFTVPNPTLFSSQEGPDWMITVGAIHPDSKGSYSGHGKPADIANIGSRYPSQGGDTTAGEGTFGGTSSATPTTAGTYARALWFARNTLGGISRDQSDGIIARGEPVPCGDAYVACELGDGILTAKELRTRLFQGAEHRDGVVLGITGVTAPVSNWEAKYLSQGHGALTGRLDGDAAFDAEFARIIGPLTGVSAPFERPAGETEWMIVDSWCRQSLWGTWRDGYYVDGETTLPADDPEWPTRTSIANSCDSLFPPV